MSTRFHMPEGENSMPSYMNQSYASLFSAYHSFSATVMLLRTIVNEIIHHIPEPIRAYISTLFFRLFKFRFSSNLIMTIDQYTTDDTPNQVYEAAELYLQSKISSETKCLRLSKTPRETKASVSIDKDQQTIDTFENIPLKWSYFCEDKPTLRGNKFEGEICYYVLEFPSVHKEKVMESYIPYVFAQAEAIKEAQKVIKIYSRSMRSSYDATVSWGSTNLEHPATFETLAMEAELKKTIVEDLDRFLRRKEFYKKVGKAWKRGYLLYGPPGTGKSSLIAAMANYLKFDIYDLELTSVLNNADLKKILLSTKNRSILVIEDIDCSVKVQNRDKEEGESSGSDSDSDTNEVTSPKSKFTLSGLLNFTDGLWSSCGDERIVVFTTNHKERLDPALLRPGRMDKHIHMSYCTPSGFKVLASNYLGIGEDKPHRLCEEIQGLIASTEVTPAEIAEELMKSDDADVALQALVDFVKRKKVEIEEREAAEEEKKRERRLKRMRRKEAQENIGDESDLAV